MPSIEIDLAAINNFILTLGQLPPTAFFLLLLKWIGTPIFIIVILWGANLVYIYNMKVRYARKQKKILLAIDIPKDNEQTPKAVENILSHLAGGHTPVWWWDTYKEGEFQQSFSLEIVSIEGNIQFLIHLNVKMRDLVEAAIFAQYPQAHITEVSDYTVGYPERFPNEEYDLFGTELVYVKNDAYPIKVYHTFGDPLNQEYKDPIAALLESLSRMGKGEQVWFQIILTPIYQEWTSIGAKEIDKLLGKKPATKKNALDKISDAPLNALKGTGNLLFGPGEAGAVQEKKPEGKKIMELPPGEVNVLKLIDEKCSKIGFSTKIRFVYLAKHEVFSKAKPVYGIIGAIKQFNVEDGNSLKPDYKIIGTSGDYFFKWRKNAALANRKMDIMMGYRKRLPGIGTKPIIMNIEEIASLWHFPVMSVKTPLVRKIEMKTSEPPSNLPGGGGDDPFSTMESFAPTSSEIQMPGQSVDDVPNKDKDPFDFNNDFFEKQFAVSETRTVQDLEPPKPPSPPMTFSDDTSYEKPFSPFSDSDFVGDNNGDPMSNGSYTPSSSPPTAPDNFGQNTINDLGDDEANPTSSEPPTNLPI